jgi:hypothetical protein
LNISRLLDFRVIRIAPFIRNSRVRLSVYAICCVALSACTIDHQLVFSAADQSAIASDANFANLAHAYYQGTTTDGHPMEPKQARNAIIRQLMLLDDLSFQRFALKLYNGRAVTDTVTEIVTTSLTAAATGLTPGTATRVLSGLATGISSSKLSVDKNLFLQQTTPTLVAKMEAQRKIVDANIQQFLKQPIDIYPLEEGLRDFVRYYRAGTLSAAALALSSGAELDRDAANATLQQTKLTNYGTSGPLQEARPSTRSFPSTKNSWMPRVSGLKRPSRPKDPSVTSLN